MSGGSRLLIVLMILAAGFVARDIIKSHRPAFDVEKALVGKTVALAGGRLVPAPAGKPKFYLFYFSASWCGPCHRFTPELVKFYREQKAAHPDFEVILVSRDRSQADMVRYMDEFHMPWPAMAQPGRQESAIEDLSGRGIPCLVLVDAHGKVLAHSYKGNRYVGPFAPLEELSRIWKATPARG